MRHVTISPPSRQNWHMLTLFLKILHAIFFFRSYTKGPLPRLVCTDYRTPPRAALRFGFSSRFQLDGLKPGDLNSYRKKPSGQERIKNNLSLYGQRPTQRLRPTLRVGDVARHLVKSTFACCPLPAPAKVPVARTAVRIPAVFYFAICHFTVSWSALASYSIHNSGLCNRLSRVASDAPPAAGLVDLTFDWPPPRRPKR
jgi:hypothetical protein